jgi:hypothetical protein
VLHRPHPVAQPADPLLASYLKSVSKNNRPAGCKMKSGGGVGRRPFWFLQERCSRACGMSQHAPRWPATGTGSRVAVLCTLCECGLSQSLCPTPSLLSVKSSEVLLIK